MFFTLISPQETINTLINITDRQEKEQIKSTIILLEDKL